MDIKEGTPGTGLPSRCRRPMTAGLSLVAFAVLGLVAHSSHALIGAVDEVPATTLLYPYFEVDLDNPSGTQTLISVTSTTATAVLSHVTLWSDLGVPVFTFDIYLTGYDTHSFSVRDILVDGIVPRSASAGQDPGDTISPKGPHSQDINFASCNGFLPPAPLPATWQIPTSAAPYNLTSVDSLQKELTGKASTRQTSLDPASTIKCVGHDYNDRIARGYITMDTVNSCTSQPPTDASFFANRIKVQNVLVGDTIIVNTTTGRLYMANSAQIEGNLTDPVVGTAGRYTFYGRYNGWDASDKREPLATNWGGINVASGQTDAVVWRDTKTPYTPSTSLNCPASPGAAPGGAPWQPLTHEQMLAFDTQENSVVPTGLFSFATGRYALGGADMPIPGTSKVAWLFSNLNTAIAGNPNPTSDPNASQSFVSFLRRPQGSAFSGGSAAGAVALDSGTAANHTPLN